MSQFLGFMWGVAPFGILLLKGRLRSALAWFLLTYLATAISEVAGASFGFIALATSARLARPGSWWSGRFYDQRKRMRASARHSGAHPRHPNALAVVAWAWLILGALLSLMLALI